MNKVLIIPLLSLLSLTGCRDDSSSSTPENTAPAMLSPVHNATDFEHAVKRNLKALGSVRPQPSVDTLPVLESVSDADGALAPSSTRFSTTTVQEAGVDESDLVKFDGRYLYVTQHNSDPLLYPTRDAAILSHTPVSSDTVRILETTGASAIERATISLQSDQTISGLYLGEASSKTPLMIISSKYHWDYNDWFLSYYWSGDSSLELDIYDVDHPPSPVATASISIDGTYISSRRIGNKVFVVSRYYPEITSFVPYPSDEATASNNAAIVDALDVNTLLPKRRVNGKTAVNHVTASDCLMPTDIANDDVYLPYIITVTTIDLETPADMKVTCVMGETSGLYASTQSLYLFDQSDWQNTLIHKFGLSAQGARYAASGVINGHIGWNQPHLRFSEYNGDLRVISSDSESTHHLAILREDGNSPSRLSIVATLPNAEHPAPIGKPNESLYAVRFLGTRAYAVTFVRTDPLYVLDLSNPLSPTIAGELELPGFSDYLQPLGNDILLGVGQDATIVNGATVIQGIKVGLFNVANPTQPTLLDEQIIGKRGSYSTASNDYHALSLMQVADSGRYRLVLPAIVYDDNSELGSGGADYYPWQSSLFRFYDIDTAASSPRLQSTGDLVVDSSNGDTSRWPSEYFFRSVIAGDDVHAVYGSDVWSAPWASPDTATGPQ